MNISIINGPNLNMLGIREPEIYGSFSLADIQKSCHELATELSINVDFYQSNHEGEIVESIHKAHEKKHTAIIINAAAYTHTSVAILDALKATNIPVYEVHLSNVHGREAFRHKSYISAIAEGIICGLGIESYLAAMRAIAHKFK